MHRRHFLQQSAIVLGTAPFAVMQPKRSNPFFMEDVVKLRLGAFACRVFHDLQFQYAASDFFINVPDKEVRQALVKYHSNGLISSPFISLLIEQQDKKILVDTGVGFSEKPVMVRDQPVLFQGKLQSLLQGEGIRKEDITDVIITHCHPDHIGGIFDGDRLNFPNARFHMHEDEWNYWHSSASANQPAQFKSFVEKNITKLKEGNLQLIKGDFVDLLPGISVIKAAGHTPGQVAVDVHSQDEHLLYISDAFLHPLHIENLDWQTNYDLDREKAAQTRNMLLELAYRDNMRIQAFHFTFPGLGRVDKKGRQWAWRYEEV
jgi:glyoxylase-like metal-dependent hydrolase (beta-lactamase superfamily II)